MNRMLLNVFLCAIVLAAIGVFARPAQAATASLITDVGSNYINERCTVSLSSFGSYCHSIDYYANKLGGGSNNHFLIYGMMLPGPATYTVPGPPQWVNFDMLPSGTYVCLVIAHGTNPGGGAWDASSGGTNITL